jgi:hypothetical protein
MSGFTIVLLTEDPLAAAPAVAEALAVARGVPAIDVAREARSCWGLVGDNREEKECGHVVSFLKERGIGAKIVPTASLPDLPRVQAVRKIEIEEAGFRCKLLRGMSPTIPWRAVTMVAAAIVKTSSYKTETREEGPSKSEKLVRMGITLATGIPIPGGRSRTVQVKKETTSFAGILDLALDKPAGRLRMEADSLDTSYLGSRRGLDSMGNFKLVVADAVDRVPPEDVNRGARMIHVKANPSTMGYDDVKEFEREERWMATRRALR